ncbi:BatA domain-containing protein [Pedobacter aquatilis]|uniref:BatA domain-containing protein n=1 Tax=Pedobacter aquatilis TaxID=351343 RepID=UPI00292FCBEB|nr:BatA domain-containing protein [Pedobacter aquatilis]
MHFLYPIGFLAFAGLIIPLIIHLWNVKQGKTLKIGSIVLLGESSRASSKSFRINDWLLLLLRALLLILIAFLITQPFLRKTISNKGSGWILVEKSMFPQVFKDNRKTIDSLLKLNYKIHDFNTGFANIELKDTINTDTSKAGSISYTSLLNQLNGTLSSGNTVYLFADRRLAKFGNQLPQTGYKLQWKALNQTDTLSSWITDYAGKKYEAKSTPSNTTYTAIKDNNIIPVKIAIYETAGNNDKKYLIAALKAIESFTGRRIEINPTGKADIAFWLSAKPVASDFKSAINTNGTLFQYESGKIIDEHSFIIIEGNKVTLNKRIEAPKSLSNSWEDGFGNTVLAKEKANNINIFHFYNRLNPQWNQLVWDETFIKALLPIIFPDQGTEDFGFEQNPADQRQLSEKQEKNIQVSTPSLAANTIQSPALSNFFWIAALLLFIIERILSFGKKTTVYVKN